METQKTKKGNKEKNRQDICKRGKETEKDTERYRENKRERTKKKTRKIISE